MEPGSSPNADCAGLGCLPETLQGQRAPRQSRCCRPGATLRGQGPDGLGNPKRRGSLDGLGEGEGEGRYRRQTSWDTHAKDKDTEAAGHRLKGKHGDIRTMLPYHLALSPRVASPLNTSLPPPPPSLGISHGATMEQKASPGASGLEDPSLSSSLLGWSSGVSTRTGGETSPFWKRPLC